MNPNFALFVFPFFAGTLTAAEFSLETLPARIRSSHPALAAARLTIEEARGRQDQAGRWSNPSVEAEFRPSTDFGESTWTIGFSQQFPRTDRLRKEKAAATSVVSAAEAEVLEQERQLVAQADELAIRWIALNEEKTLLNEQAAIATRLSENTSRIAREGEAPSLEAVKARLDAATARVQAKRLEAEMKEAAGQLRGLLGLPPAEPLEITGGFPLPFVPTPVSDLTVRPDYQLARHQWESAKSQLEAEREKNHAEPTIGFFASLERAEDFPRGTDDTVFAGVRVSLPFPFHDRREGALRETRARRDRLQAGLGVVLHQAATEAATARAQMLELNPLLAEYDTKVLPLAEDQAAQADLQLNQGEGVLKDVLTAKAQLVQLKIARLHALRDFHLARQRFLSATSQR